MPLQVFEQIVLPHLDAAFTYARWLTRNDAEAEDVVQDACVRAMRYFPSLRHDNARAWLLGIVRNTWYSHVARRAGLAEIMPLDGTTDHPADDAHDPEALLVRQQAVTQVRWALERLPVDYREVIILREIEGLSYKEIAAVANIPIGTVMSRLLRARERLRIRLNAASRGMGPDSTFALNDSDQSDQSESSSDGRRSPWRVACSNAWASCRRPHSSR
jgi:RNA polymerase sigma factor (sigma-70 family)